jgi:rhodanese-related sulfurtransferase
MAPPERISPEQVRRKQSSGNVVLVCAYDSDEKFRQYHLDGAISLSDFRAREKSLPKQQEVVFYCA